MPRSKKVHHVVPTNLFTDGTYYYGIVSNMIMRTRFITYAIFHTHQETPIVSALLTKYGVNHTVECSKTFRNPQVETPCAVKERVYTQVDNFSVTIKPHEFKTLAAAIPQISHNFFN